MSLEVHQPPRFAISDPQQLAAMLQYLEAHGYAVVANAADASQVRDGVQMFWQHMEATSSVRRDDTSTWTNRQWPGQRDTGIMRSPAFSHSAFSWHTRTLPTVRKAFAAIWDSDELLVSYDVGGAFRPWHSDPRYRTAGGWWHVDQNSRLPDRTGRVCVQGLVTYTDASAATGGFCCVPDSHHRHSELCDKHGDLPMDYVHIPSEEVLGGSGRLLAAQAGDLILWDSRLIHCNTPAGHLPAADADAVSASDESGLLRLVSYVCMLPRAAADADLLYRRKVGFICHMPTSHWPTERLPYVPLGLSLFAARIAEAQEDWTKAAAAVLRLVGFSEREIRWRMTLDFPALPKPL